MTELEIRKWLGLRPEHQIASVYQPWWDRVVAGMAETAPPPDGLTDEHLRVFKAFLACSGPPPERRAAVKSMETTGTGALT